MIALAAICIGVAAWSYRTQSVAMDGSVEMTNASKQSPRESSLLELKPQARKNLNLAVAVARPTRHWRTITIPGVVQDRPGVSDRGVTSPAVGTVSEIHRFEGDTVSPGGRLITIQLFSEYLQATQTQLFKSAKELEIIQGEIQRLAGVTARGGVSGSKLIALENDAARQETLVVSAKQELLNRGLSPAQIRKIEAGEFVSSVEVSAPPKRATDQETATAYELQTLAVELGQSVQAGHLLVSLADHSQLYVVGHAFKHESELLQSCAQSGQQVEIEFADDDGQGWPDFKQPFRIRHLANTIDPQSRTLDFFVPVTNQSRSFNRDGEPFLVWRFRPGQRARIHVPVEEFTDVFVVPIDGVAFEGPQAYVYRQNGDLFKQIAVQVVHKDRRNVVIAGDGSFASGSYLAQNAAASLRRILKAQSKSDQPPGYHVHADGSVHAEH